MFSLSQTFHMTTLGGDRCNLFNHVFSIVGVLTLIITGLSLCGCQLINIPSCCVYHKVSVSARSPIGWYQPYILQGRKTESQLIWNVIKLQIVRKGLRVVLGNHSMPINPKESNGAPLISKKCVHRYCCVPLLILILQPTPIIAQSYWSPTSPQTQFKGPVYV